MNTEGFIFCTKISVNPYFCPLQPSRGSTGQWIGTKATINNLMNAAPYIFKYTSTLRQRMLWLQWLHHIQSRRIHYSIKFIISFRNSWCVTAIAGNIFHESYIPSFTGQATCTDQAMWNGPPEKNWESWIILLHLKFLQETYLSKERERLSLSAFLRTEDIGVHIVHISRLIITYTLE